MPAHEPPEELDTEPTADPPSHASRREFLRWVGVSAAIAAGGCGRTPNERRYPYNEAPIGLTPGLPQTYATAHVTDGYALGLLVRSREGRPLKVEGNPQHPASLGATGAIEQALVLGVYDPHRLSEPTRAGEARTWAELARELRPTGAGRGAGAGGALRLLLPPTGSPLRVSLLQAILREHPDARCCLWAPTAHRGGAEALRRIGGRPLQPHYRVNEAERILALDADFAGQMPNAVRLARELAAGRRVESADATMHRLYMVEAKPSVTGSLADERLACTNAEVGLVAALVLRALLTGTDTGGAPGLDAGLARGLDPLGAAGADAFVRAVAQDLDAHRSRSLVIAGERQPWPVHVLAYALNTALGNLGRTVQYSEPVLFDPGVLDSDRGIGIEALADELRRGEVHTLIVADLDPVYALPPELELAAAIERVPLSVYWGTHASATSRRCTWTVPARHPLESWGDAVGYDGTISFQQPLIDPIGAAWTLDELLALVLGRPQVRARQLLRELWAPLLAAADAGEAAPGPDAGVPTDAPTSPWAAALQLGLQPGSGATAVPPPGLSDPVLGDALTIVASAAAAAKAAGGLELALYESPTVLDGRHFHNVWLQELPDPITKQTWGNAWMLSPGTAARLGVVDGQQLTVRAGEREVSGPAVVVPTHADGVISTYVGYGQRLAERPHFDPLEPVPPAQVGFNAFALRSSADAWWRAGVEVRVDERAPGLARTQEFFDARGRPLALAASLATLRRRGELAEHLRGPSRHLWLLPRPSGGRQWGMVIDQTVCTGCSACVVACQAENNIAVVGEVGVRQGREMHWLRVDRYYVDVDGVERAVHQPMLCQHCEYAPCEYVCPVNATVHSPDGLNEMVYNRCIGTRFCSNNCPYKVRRFNWFDFAVRDRRMLQRNPEVTVRERGVMEKCTYCVQRVRNAEIQAALDDRAVADGELQTACQQACPTRAIAFGDLSDRNSAVSQWRARPHQYAALHDQGTSPRTRYLVKLFNSFEPGASS